MFMGSSRPNVIEKIEGVGLCYSPKQMSKIIFLFDLDGTLAVSKSSIDQQMKDLLTAMLQTKHPYSRTVCVISGGKFEQFKEQLVDKLEDPELFSRLHLFPTCGTAYYKWNGMNDEFDSEGNPLGKWEAVYEHVLSPEEKDEILQAFDVALKRTNYGEETTYGKIIEDRSTKLGPRRLTTSPNQARIRSAFAKFRGSHRWNYQH
jgi:hydroxymethylpyrimidine pyrophosphatase-like HAD family hydrolase